MDPLGNQMFANEIYDPATRGVTSSGLGYASPFPGNVIPPTRFSPLTVNLQTLISSLGVAAQDPSLTRNYTGSIPGVPILGYSVDQDRSQSIPRTSCRSIIRRPTPGARFPLPWATRMACRLRSAQYRGTFIPAWTERLNYDRTLTPTLLLHLGVGYYYTSFSDQAAFLSFNPSQFGLSWLCPRPPVPVLHGMCSSSARQPDYGGMQTIGTAGQIQSSEPTRTSPPLTPT